MKLSVLIDIVPRHKRLTVGHLRLCKRVPSMRANIVIGPRDVKAERLSLASGKICKNSNRLQTEGRRATRHVIF